MSKLDQLTATDPRSRLQAARELGGEVDLDLPRICELLLAERSVLVRRELRAALDRICEQRQTTMTALLLEGEIPPRRLVEAMFSDHEETRLWALAVMEPRQAAEMIRSGRASMTFVTKLPRASVTRVGWWAGLILAELGDPRAAGALANALRRGSRRTREWMRQALGEIGYVQLVETMCRQVDADGASIRDRCAAVRALGALGHPRALPTLQRKVKLWSFVDRRIKDACREAIKAIEERGLAVLPTSSSAPPPSALTLPRTTEPERPETTTLPKTSSGET